MPLKVYYLDDECELCENFEEFFASDKVSVTTFTDHKRALAAAKVSPPDIFFIDFRLPEITGEGVAMALDPEIPKYLITGDISLSDSPHFIKTIAKPYNPEEIRKVLQRYF